MAPQLTTMDRIDLAIIASAILLVLGAAGLYVTRTANLMTHARTIGAARSGKREALAANRRIQEPRT